MHGELALTVDGGTIMFARDNVIKRPSIIGLNPYPFIPLGMFEPVDQYLKSNQVLVFIAEASRAAASNRASYAFLCWHCCSDPIKLIVRE